MMISGDKPLILRSTGCGIEGLSSFLYFLLTHVLSCLHMKVDSDVGEGMIIDLLKMSLFMD